MGVLTFFSYSARSINITSGSEMAMVSATGAEAVEVSALMKVKSKAILTPPGVELSEAPISPKDTSLPTTSLTAILDMPTHGGGPDSNQPTTEARARRFSFRALSFGLSHRKQKPVLSIVQDHERRHHATAVFSKRFMKTHISHSDKRAKKSALIVQSLIIGPTSMASPQLTPTNAKPQLSKIKSQLIKPKSANKVIAQLRALPVSYVKDGEKAHVCFTKGPIHAVCLEHTDAEEHKLHFAPLSQTSDVPGDPLGLPGVSSVSLDKLTMMFNEMNVVDLVKSPDLGLGQPGDGPGLLAGAVPTAETVIKGIEQITPQLMALGYATGQAFLPDHAGVYPPTDRMSVLTYWWGLELVLPPPSLEYLANAQSIAGTVVNFLSALSLINNGVREILPFVRYIAQFIDYEFNSIKRQDKGRGVVCAATWIMPAAMVPRPWDFPDPSQDGQPAQDGRNVKADTPVISPNPNPTLPTEASSPPLDIPLSLPYPSRQASAAPEPRPDNALPTIIHVK